MEFVAATTFSTSRGRRKGPALSGRLPARTYRWGMQVPGHKPQLPPVYLNLLQARPVGPAPKPPAGGPAESAAPATPSPGPGRGRIIRV